MNLNSPLAQNPVIPAQAGIQIIKKSPAKRDNIAVLSADETTSHSTKLAKKRQQSRWLFAGCLSLLDSRLRGNDGLRDYLG